MPPVYPGQFRFSPFIKFAGWQFHRVAGGDPVFRKPPENGQLNSRGFRKCAVPPNAVNDVLA